MSTATKPARTVALLSTTVCDHLIACRYNSALYKQYGAVSAAAIWASYSFGSPAPFLLQMQVRRPPEKDAEHKHSYMSDHCL